jgi:hypothetical protein
MVSDKELFRQMLERDVMNLYNQLPDLLGGLGINIKPYMGLFENKILSYADTGIDAAVAWLFGKDDSCDIDEAADIAKMMANDKIEEYRKRVRESRKEADKLQGE